MTHVHIRKIEKIWQLLYSLPYPMPCPLCHVAWQVSVPDSFHFYQRGRRCGGDPQPSAAAVAAACLGGAAGSERLDSAGSAGDSSGGRLGWGERMCETPEPRRLCFPVPEAMTAPQCWERKERKLILMCAHVLLFFKRSTPRESSVLGWGRSSAGGFDVLIISRIRISIGTVV